MDNQLEEDIKASINKKAKQISANIISRIEKIMTGLEYEKRETMKMMKTFFLKLKDKLKNQKTVTDKDMKRALNQLKSVGKLSIIAPLFMLPGGGTTTTVLYFTGKKLFNISILPTGLEQVFEDIGIDILDKNLSEVLTETQNSNIIKNLMSFREYVENGGLNDSKERKILPHL